MPSRAESFGPWIVTGFPSKNTSPLSNGWIPATDLMRVDLPAPLSPTSDITSPSRTSKSTSVSACTDPNDFDTPRSSSVGAAAIRGFLPPSADLGRRDVARTPRLPAFMRLRAVLLVDPDADLALLHEALPEQERVVRLRDPDRRQQDRLRAADRAVRLDRLTLDEVDRGLRGGVRLGTDGLVDRAALPAGDDVLHALRRRILAGDGDRLEAVVLERRDDGVAEPVVGGDRGVDLVAVPSEDLLEDRQRLLVVPVGPLVAAGRLLEDARLVQRSEHRVVALLEQLGVVVGDAAVQLGDDGMGAVLAALLQRGDEPVTHELADLHVVEGHVVGGLAADDEAVVVDDLALAGDDRVRDRRAGACVEGVEEHDLRAVREAVVRLGAHLLRAALGVDDRRGDAGLLERGREVRPVEELVTHRGLRVRKEHADVGTRRCPLARGRRRGDAQRRQDEDRQAHDRHCRAYQMLLHIYAS